MWLLWQWWFQNWNTKSTPFILLVTTQKSFLTQANFSYKNPAHIKQMFHDMLPNSPKCTSGLGSQGSRLSAPNVWAKQFMSSLLYQEMYKFIHSVSSSYLSRFLFLLYIGHCGLNLLKHVLIHAFRVFPRRDKSERWSFCLLSTLWAHNITLVYHILFCLYLVSEERKFGCDWTTEINKWCLTESHHANLWKMWK